MDRTVSDQLIHAINVRKGKLPRTTSRAARLAILGRTWMGRLAFLAPLVLTPRSARRLASHAKAASRRLVRATARPAAQGKARTSRGRAATRALLVRFQSEGRQIALRALQDRTARLGRRAVSPAARALA